MVSMGYCRFENTLADLRECYKHLRDCDLSVSEEMAKKKLMDLCKEMTDEQGDCNEEETKSFKH